MVEEVKWRKPSNSMRGVPVWSHDGIICTGETYKSVVKLTFAKGASLKDPSGLFNASLEGNVRRAIDIHEGDKIDEKALKALIRAAVALNISARATARLVRSQKKTKECLRSVVKPASSISALARPERKSPVRVDAHLVVGLVELDFARRLYRIVTRLS